MTTDEPVGQPPPMQPTWLLVLPWILLFGAGVLSLVGPGLELDAGGLALRARDVVWLLAGWLMVVSGLRGMRTAGAPRVSWVLPVFGVALIVGAALLARESLQHHDRLAEGQAELVALFEEQAADEQVSLRERAHWSLELARLRFAVGGQLTDVLSEDGAVSRFTPRATDQRARQESEALAAQRVWLDGAVMRALVALLFALVLGAVLTPRAWMRLRPGPR